MAIFTRRRGNSNGPPRGPPLFDQAGDDGQLRQEPSRRRPDHDNPDKEIIMATTTLTPPAALASPAAEQLAGSDPGTILALDLATNTGWALCSTNGQIISGTVSFRPSRYDGGGMRYLRFTNWLTELDRLSGPIAAIYYEEIRRHAGTDAAHVYGGLMATLTSWAELRGVPYQGAPVGTWKRSVCGKGNAKKEDVVDAMRARGFNPSGADEADALAILHWAIATRGVV
jgi:hypothetical protein